MYIVETGHHKLAGCVDSEVAQQADLYGRVVTEGCEKNISWDRIVNQDRTFTGTITADQQIAIAEEFEQVDCVHVSAFNYQKRL